MNSRNIASADTIKSWNGFLRKLRSHKNRAPSVSKNRRGRRDDGTEWIFRGLHEHCELKSSLERHLEDFDIEPAKAPDVEHYLIREFRRHYDGPDRELVEGDTLYCLGLLQHYGAPTRLLDWTYSPFVAMYFALEKFADAQPKSQMRARDHVGYLWCLEANACSKVAQNAVNDNYVKRESLKLRFPDKARSDCSFRGLYIDPPIKRFVLPENPWRFHVRHRNQQGVFLCPGDVTTKFQVNIEAMGFIRGACKQYKIIMDRHKRYEALEQLRRMNVTRASLFPGLDGFAKSLEHRLPYFKTQGDRCVGRG